MLKSTIGKNEENKKPDRHTDSENKMAASLYDTSFALLGYSYIWI